MLMTRRKLVKDFKTLFAAHHFVHVSKDIDEIASVVNISRRRLESLMDTPEFLEALSFWNHKPIPAGDFDLAEQVWTEIIKNGEDLFPVEYPDEPLNLPQNNSCRKTDTLIRSHLFCVNNLSGDEILTKLAEDCNPVPYEGQHIRGYHYFAYPNAAEGLYSKVLARVNVVGDLVIDLDFGDKGDETCLVCILHGRLTITQQVSDGVVNILDKRLLLCL
ncbi:MAG: hypothetical protein F4Z15_00360 [Gammaproteobacteria bacterium]|nr:hypothetical protein [Gammaproteobacteria bacterium]